MRRTESTVPSNRVMELSSRSERSLWVRGRRPRTQDRSIFRPVRACPVVVQLPRDAGPFLFAHGL